MQIIRKCFAIFSLRINALYIVQICLKVWASIHKTKEEQEGLQGEEEKK
jgi:hypothetical protein